MTAYRRGYLFERRVAADYKRRGWVTIQSRGSHGPCDVIAAKGCEINVIQCKAAADGYLTPAERSGLIAIAAEFGAIPIVACRVWHKIVYRVLQRWEPDGSLD